MKNDNSGIPDHIEEVIEGGDPGDILDEYKGNYYIIKEASDGSCVVLARYDRETGGEEIAAIDNSQHWDHIDTEYHLHKPGQEKPEEFKGNIDDAYNELKSNWEEYVDIYLDE